MLWMPRRQMVLGREAHYHDALPWRRTLSSLRLTNCCWLQRLRAFKPLPFVVISLTHHHSALRPGNHSVERMTRQVLHSPMGWMAFNSLRTTAYAVSTSILTQTCGRSTTMGVTTLGRVEILRVVATGRVQILARERVRGGHVDVRGSYIVAADARNASDQPHGYGVYVLQGAFTLWNMQPDDDVVISADLIGISAGRSEAPVLGSGIS